jgi:hypothetical protein
MDFIDGELLADVTMDLSRSGQIYRTEELRKIASQCTPEQAVEIYCFLRDNGERFESEWRDAFTAIFPSSEPLLPPVADSDEWQNTLFDLIAKGDLSKVRDFLRSIGTLDTEFDPQDAIESARYHSFGPEAKYVPFDIYPIQGENEHGVTAPDHARQQGQQAIADYLEGVIAELTVRWKAAYSAGYRGKTEG